MMENNTTLTSFTDVFADENQSQLSQPLSISSSISGPKEADPKLTYNYAAPKQRPAKHTGQHGEFRSVEEIDPKYRCVFSYPFFNLVQSKIIEDALYTDKSLVVCAPTGSGKTVVFEMAIVQLLMELEDKQYTGDYKIIYMAPVKAVCTERLAEWYPKLTKLGLLCIEVTGDTDVEFTQLKPYKVIITTPEKWDILTRRWTDYRGLVETVKLFLIDEVHILNDESRGPVLEAVVSRMKTVQASAQSTYRIERLKQQYDPTSDETHTIQYTSEPRIRFVAVSATVSNPEDVASWLGEDNRPALYHKFGDECRPVKLKRIVEGYPCSDGTSIFKFDYILNYKLWPIIQKYYNGKPTLIFCNTRKSVALTAETLVKELTVTFHSEQKAKLNALASTIKNKKLQTLVSHGVGCHHAGLLYEERLSIEMAFRKRELPILITTTTLAMGVNLPAHLVIIKNTQQYVNGSYQEYSITTILQMVGRAGRPQFDNEATAVIMTRMQDKARYEALVGGSEPLQSYLHKRMTENLNSEAALHTVTDVAQCVQWLRSTFLYVRAAKDPRRYLGLPSSAPQHQISKKIEELCVKAMNGLASAGLISMDEACCIESTEAGRLMSIYYLDFETMKKIMKIEGSENLEQLLRVVCECHELSDMHLRVDERRHLNMLNRNNAAATIRYPMKGKISTREMKLSCVIQAVLGCLPIPDPSLNQEAMKIMRIADRVCKCLVAYMTRPALVAQTSTVYSAVLNSIILAKCLSSHLWENSPYLSKQLKGIGPTFSTLLASAGKTNFALLEESHPRDLERVMNKGPPAGNILHKQITLLPKYQLTINPVDEKTVTVQLLLLNQYYLSEHMNDLTAGENHKSYIVIGDTENYLILLSSFKDKDLISMYDGQITYTVTRKHRFEHKMLAHCISSNFVGLDAHCDYLFKSLEPEEYTAKIATMQNLNITPRKPMKRKQTDIRESMPEKRKRKPDTDMSQSRDKKKRDSDLIEKFKTLKASFGAITKEIQSDFKNVPVISSKNIEEPKKDDRRAEAKSYKGDFDIYGCEDPSKLTTEEQYWNEVVENGIEESDTQIENILNNIEYEMNNKTGEVKQSFGNNRSTKVEEITQSALITDTTHPVKTFCNIECNSNRKAQSVKKHDNFKFIELLEKNMHFSDEESSPEQGSAGFTEAIKSQVTKYLQNAKNNKGPVSTFDDELLSNEFNRSVELNTKTQEVDTEERNETFSRDFNSINNLSDSLLKLPNANKNTIIEHDTIKNLKTSQIGKRNFWNETYIPMNKDYADPPTNLRDLNNKEGNGQNASYNALPDIIIESQSATTRNQQYENNPSDCSKSCHVDSSFDTSITDKSLTDDHKWPQIQSHNSANNKEVSIDSKNHQQFSSESFPVKKDEQLALLPHFAESKTTAVDEKSVDSKLISYHAAEKIFNTTKPKFGSNVKTDNVGQTGKCSFSSTKVQVWKNPFDFGQYTVKVVQKIDVDINFEPNLEKYKRPNNDEVKYREMFVSDIFEEPFEPEKNISSFGTHGDEIKKINKPMITTGGYEEKQANHTPTLVYSNLPIDYTENGNRIKGLCKPNSTRRFEPNQDVICQKESNTKAEDEKNPSSVKDILQKYAKAMRNNLKSTQITMSSGQCSTSERQSTKVNRPFRIRDIQNISSRLPATIVSTTTNTDTEQYYHTTGTHRNDSITHEINEVNSAFEVEEQSPSPCEEENDQQNTTTYSELLTPQVNFDVTLAETPPHVDLRVTETKEPSQIDDIEPYNVTYNVDEVEQSMLDPKALLLYCTKDDDEEVLPPPPEFCDNGIYSPSPQNEELNISETDYTYNDIKSDDYETNFEQGFFTANSEQREEKRASPEVWYLSPEKLNDFYNPELSSTRIPNMTGTFNLSSRKEKLSKFKMNPKTQYRK